MRGTSDVSRFELVMKKKSNASARKALGSLLATKYLPIGAIFVVQFGNVPTLDRG